MNDHNYQQDLVGAYLLDALDLRERDDFESHLEHCAECRAEVRDLSGVVSVLPLACEPAAPSEMVLDRILQTLAAEGSDSRSRSHLVPLPGGAPKARSWLRGPGAALVAAAAVLVAGLGTWDVKLQQKVNDQQHSIAFQQTINSALAHGAHVVPIPATNRVSTASAAIVQNSAGHGTYFVVQGLPSTPANKVYQLWFVRGGTPSSAGTFRYSGSQPKIVVVPLRTNGFTVAALTIEPGPKGSQVPTGQKLLNGKLSA